LADPDSDVEFKKYYDYVKKMIADSNAVTQEAGISTALIFIQNAPKPAQ